MIGEYILVVLDAFMLIVFSLLAEYFNLWWVVILTLPSVLVVNASISTSVKAMNSNVNK